MDTGKLSVATEHELRNISGVVYRIEFTDGDWYVGATLQTFAARYGTLELSRSAIANPSIKAKAKTHRWEVYLLHTGINSLDELRVLEEREIGDEHMTCPRCLNRRRGGKGKDTSTRIPITLMSPDGQIHEFISRTRAAETIGTTPQQIVQLASGRWRSVMGWTLLETRGPVGHAISRKPCTIVDPNGKVHEFESLSAAAVTIGVSTACVSSLCNGLVTTTRGWHLPGVEPRKYMKTVLVSPGGEVVAFPSRKAASEQIGCCSQLISSLMRGRAPSACGWTVPSLQGHEKLLKENEIR